MARRLWEERTVVEHRSATVFSDLLPQLRDVGVPLDLEAVVLQCALDEIRHAELCGRLAQALGGDGAQPCELRARRLPRHGDVSPRTRLLRNVVYACAMSETLATAMLTMSRDEAREPNVRRVLQALLADEVRHSRFGWDVLEHLAPLGDQDRRDLERYLRFAFAHWEGAVPRRPGGSKRLPADAAALGVPSPAASYALFENVVAEAILPGLERHGVDARRAWRKRDPASP